MKKILYSLTLLALFVSACTPTSTPQSQSVDDIVASTFQAMTANAPTAAQTTPGIPVSLSGLSFTIPIGLASGATVSPQIPPVSNGGDMPWWEIFPPYNEYPLAGYSLTGSFPEAKLYVYPADEYAQLNEDAGRRIQALRDLLSAPESLSVLIDLPFLPTYNAAQVFHSNAQAMSFQNGRGVRYITMFSQFPGGIVNGAVFYTFQGLTSDGTYYLSATLPIHVPFLEDGVQGAVLPPDGIPFDQGNFDAYPAYVAAVTTKLNSANPNLFNPTLSNLDALVQSVLVSAQTVTVPAATSPETNNQFTFSDFGAGIKFYYPAGLAQGLANETISASALQAPQTFDYPQHVAVYFSSYSEPDQRDGWAPGIYVFRVTDLNIMQPELVGLIQGQTASSTSEHRVSFPRLPFPGHSVDAQFKNVAFQNGTGFRYLVTGGFAAQAPNGTGLTYAYTGFTNDGKYLVGIFFPVTAPMIADLADGHPYVSQEDATNSTNALNALVNGGADSAFTPSLAILDTLVQSIIITGP